MCVESPLIGDAVVRGVEESGIDRSVGELSLIHISEPTRPY